MRRALLVAAALLALAPAAHAMRFHAEPPFLHLQGRVVEDAGRCASACANMFLGGAHRHFAATLRERPATLGFHGSYNSQSGAVKWDADTDYYVAMTDGKLGEDFAELFLKLENQRGLLYFIHPSQRESEDKALAYLCQGTERQDRRDKECRSLADVDALGKGVVTTWDAVRVPRMPSAEETQARKNW